MPPGGARIPNSKISAIPAILPRWLSRQVADAQQILTFAAPQGTPLSQADISAVLAETGAGILDFNDGVLVETRRLRGWKLLTNDGDMTRGGIEVLTTYAPLLAACR